MTSPMRVLRESAADSDPVPDAAPAPAAPAIGPATLAATAALANAASGAHAAMELVEQLAEQNRIDEQAMLVIANGLRAAHTASHAYAPAEDVPIDRVVLTDAQMRRQVREMRREHAIRGCTTCADVVVEVLPRFTIPMYVANLVAVWLTVGALLVQQLSLPLGVAQKAPHVSCTHLHVIPVAVRLISTLCCSIVGSQDACIHTFGTDAWWVQQRRIAWLFYVLLIELVCLLPLVQPLTLSTVNSIGGKCEVDTALLALAQTPTPVHALTALSTILFYMHGAIACCLIFFIFAALGMSLCIERPRRFVMLFAVGVAGACFALLYNTHARRLGNAMCWLVANLDQMLSKVLCCVLGFRRDICPGSTGSSFGPGVSFLADPATLAELTPFIAWLTTVLGTALLVNLTVYVTGVL